uniref:Isoamyl acetate-hydrolyzing esterase 1 homolog n=1 Tax=Macrostomum lignano TaxID=282301 RepID=A0A1I8INF2_9PLAT
QGFAQPSGWLARLADRTQGRCDILGRGFAGYTSRWWRALAPRLLTDSLLAGCDLCGVFLGCNDSCGSGHRLHVPVAEFRDNMSCIVGHLKVSSAAVILCHSQGNSESSRRLTPQSKGLSSRQVLLINVPPVAEAGRSAPSDPEFRKSMANCWTFNRALAEAAQEVGVGLVDVFGEFLERQDWPQLLSSDGVHLSPLGSEALFDCLWPAVAERICHLPALLPDYRDVH